MISFCIALLALLAGYLIYGVIVERIFGADPQRPTPATTQTDGVDYVPMPTWRIFLIQFLNIAGLGPIFGAIMGVMYGPAAFLWIVFGSIFAGAVHDYFSGMLSLRNRGMSLPEFVGDQLGNRVKQLMRGLSLFLMILIGAVFVFNPADLLAMLTPDHLGRMFWIIVIFVYYMAATMLPIDKLIGRLYPIFGLALLFMAAGIMAMLFVHRQALPEVWEQFYNHRPDPDATPIFPMMFVSIACGAISGFHGTQSPMMARCLKNERHGRAVFYGAMITEGVVALIWAAAAVAFTHGYDNLQVYMAGKTPSVLINDLSTDWLGRLGGLLAILGVVAAPISSGDTALRSARLIAADFLGIGQKRISKRLMISVPIFAATFVVMMMPYEMMWRYFAWFNQVLAAFTLWTIAVWLADRRKCHWIALLPALFMTVVTVSYIFIAPEGFSALTLALFGRPIPYAAAVGLGMAVAVAFALLFNRRLRTLPPVTE